MDESLSDLQKEGVVSPDQTEAFIKEGLSMIKSGQYDQAYDLYHNARKFNLIGQGGKFTTISQLQTEEDLVQAVTFIAQNSKPTALAEISPNPWFDREQDKSLSFEDFPDRYKPELVRRLRGETALVWAEEYLHQLQKIKRGPVAGETDKEADIAAYFYNFGIPLTEEFVSTFRHPERKEWADRIKPDLIPVPEGTNPNRVQLSLK